jgi:hypothetical protein
VARSKQVVAHDVDRVDPVDERDEATMETSSASPNGDAAPNGDTAAAVEAPPARKRREARAAAKASRPKKPGLAERLRALTDNSTGSRQEVERLAADEWWDAISPAMEKMVERVPGSSSPQDAEARLQRETDEQARRHAARVEERRRMEEEARAAREAEAAERAQSKQTERCHHVFFDGPCGGSFSYVPSELWRTHFCVNCGTGHNWDPSIGQWVPAAPSRQRLVNGSMRTVR